MSLISDIFTWWNGATLSTRLYTQRRGLLVGEDATGNKYYTEKAMAADQKNASRTRPSGSRDDKKAAAPKQYRRWVVYDGVAEASKVPPEWYGWLHHVTDEVPSPNDPVRSWQKSHEENMTGTSGAHRPAGSILAPHRRRVGTPDYEPWRAE